MILSLDCILALPRCLNKEATPLQSPPMPLALSLETLAEVFGVGT